MNASHSGDGFFAPMSLALITRDEDTGARLVLHLKLREQFFNLAECEVRITAQQTVWFRLFCPFGQVGEMLDIEGRVAV